MANRAQIEQAMIVARDKAKASEANNDAKSAEVYKGKAVALAKALAANQFDDAKENPFVLKPGSQDAKQEGESVDFTASNKKLTDMQKIRESGIMNSPFGGVLDAAASMASGVVAEPVAGIAGLAGLPFGADRAAQNVEDTRKALTLQPKTTTGRSIVQGIGSAAQAIGDALGNPLEKSREFLGEIGSKFGGPAAGAIGTAVPDAVMMALGGVAGKALPKTGILPTAGAKVLEGMANKNKISGNSLLAEAKAIQDKFKSGAFQMNSSDPALRQVADILMRNDPAEIAAMLKTDPKFFDAVKSLGINKTAPAAYSSDNPAYRGIEQGLAAQAANPLGILGDEFTTNVQKTANDLIEKYKGSRDKAEVDKKFREDAEKTIESLASVEEAGYDKMRANLPGNAQASTKNIAAHIDAMLKTRNNDIKKLPKFLQKIYFTLKPKVTIKRESVTLPDGYVTTGNTIKTVTPPTIDILEDQRKAVGRAYNKKQGPYADEDTHMLGEAYAALRADADAMYEKAGMLAELKALNKTTQLRKELEANNIDLLGKNLSKSITFKVGSAMKGITGEGGVETFTQLMSKIKNKEMRQKVAVTAVNYLVRGSGAAKGDLSIPKFVEKMDELNKQPTAKKALSKELPKGMMEDLDNLHYISRRIYLANQSRVPTGVSAALFNQDSGLLSRLGGPTARAVFSGARMVGLGKVADTAAVIRSFVKDGKISRGEAVTKMLASPDFQAIVIDAAKPGAAKSIAATKKLELASKRFQRSKTYQDWAKTLEKSELAKLEAAGLTGYLFGPETEPLIIPITNDKTEKTQ